jgi:hypothetical protein
VCGLLLVLIFFNRSRNQPVGYPDEYHPW